MSCSSPEEDSGKRPRLSLRWAKKLAKQGRRVMTPTHKKRRASSPLPLILPISPQEEKQIKGRESDRCTSKPYLFTDYNEASQAGAADIASSSVEENLVFDSITPVPPPFSPSYIDEKDHFPLRESSSCSTVTPDMNHCTQGSSYGRERIDILSLSSEDGSMESQPSPVRWYQRWDPRYQCFYYYNAETKRSTWEPPQDTFHAFMSNNVDMIADKKDMEEKTTHYEPGSSHCNTSEQSKDRHPQHMQLNVEVPSRNLDGLGASFRSTQVSDTLMETAAASGGSVTNPHPLCVIQDLTGCSLDEARAAFQRNDYDLNQTAEAILSRQRKCNIKTPTQRHLGDDESHADHCTEKDEQHSLVSPEEPLLPISPSPNDSSSYLPPISPRSHPEEFECSITMEIMQDPVIAADGFSYERKAMEAWLTRCDRSPKTNEVLRHKILIPNHSLRSVIQDLSPLISPNSAPVTKHSGCFDSKENVD